jgi:cyclopropane fatty-acyl-phospholipid synthase-like methyltransferase
MADFFRRFIHNLWYYRRPPWDSGITPPELMEFIRSNPPARALDLGCGTGTNVLTLAQHGWQVTGIDFAPKAISIARRKIQSANISANLYVRDVTRLDGIAGPFEFILDLGCFHGLTDSEKELYLAQLQKVSAPDGNWLLYGFFKASYKTPGPGLVPKDIDRIQVCFQLVSQKDGMDRRDRPSAYFLFRKY